MIIENYSDLYYLDVLKLVDNFHKEAINEYDDVFDAHSVINTIVGFNGKNSHNAFLLIINGSCQGLLAGIDYQSMTSGRSVFQEVIWYVNKSFRRYGLRLLNEAEKRLKERGVSIMIMAVLENSKTQKIKKLYDRLGYKPMEVHYVRNL